MSPPAMPKMPDRNEVATIVETRPSKTAEDIADMGALPTPLYAVIAARGKAELSCPQHEFS
jgi:hypothetical protein